MAIGDRARAVQACDGEWLIPADRSRRGLRAPPGSVTMPGMNAIISVSSCLVAVLGLAGAASGDVALDTLFQDHAVIQRDRVIPVRGKAAPGERVTVRFGDALVHGEADEDGRFTIDLPPMPASLEPRELVVTAPSGEARARDVLVGEVWFCSGQSNMEWTVDASNEAARAKSIAAKLPIRSFKAPHVTANEPRDRVPGAWRLADEGTVGGFTAVGFWFGADLARSFDLEVPIGLVDISWGGTRIEPWIPLDEMMNSPFRDRAATLAKSIAAARAIAPEDRAKAQAEEDARHATEVDAYWAAVRELDKEALASLDGDGLGAGAGGWRDGTLPAFFPALDPALAQFDGIVWHARDFEVPAGLAGKELLLSLPAIDDCDGVWIDGELIGATMNNWTQPRRYALAAGLAAGTHRMVIAALDMAGQGGLANGPMTLATRNGGTIDLAGAWKWHRGGGIPRMPLPARRDVSKEPGTEPHEPAAIYNAMMAPCIAYPVRGAIWYQGESNAGEPDAYRKLLPLLMNSWRAKSGNPDMAWGIVQLAAFMDFAENEPAQGGWAFLREAQFRGAADGRGGMISATDLGEAKDIHPRRKREVGERLSSWARNTVYGEAAVAWKGPELASAKRDGARVVCAFANASQLLLRDGTEPGGFALAGEDGRFVWARARIDGSTVVVEADGVTEPREVAYAWQNNPERANLVNGAMLPAVPFRVALPR